MTILKFVFQNSTMLSSCDYDTEVKELTVTFNGGKSYTYIDVPKLVYNELCDAKSAGKYFNLIKKELKQKAAQ